MPAPAPGLAAVREGLGADLRRHGAPPEAVDDVTLVASELYGNAVRHGVDDHDPLEVRWDVWPAEVEVQVTDSSPQLPVVTRPDPTAPAGRGMAIVTALSSAWGVRPLSGGKVVWARVPLRPA